MGKEEGGREYYKEEGGKYVKDSTTGLWMIPVTEETCKASEGFVCKVRLDADDMTSMIIMMMMMI